MPEFTGHRDLRAYLRMVWRWKLLILVILIAAPGIAYLLERGKPHIYQSSVLVSVNSTTVGNSSSSLTTDNINTIAALVNTTPVANIAGNLLNPTVPGSDIVGEVSASPNATTGLLTITATDDSPTRAAAIANAFAKALGVNQEDELADQTNSAIAGLSAQIKELPKNSPEIETLKEQIASDKATLKQYSTGATILQAATPDTTPVGPHLRRTVELGFVIGLLLAVALVFVLEGADRRLRSPDELEGLTELPLLAAIAPSAFAGELETTPVDEEAFQTLRTSLTYFTVDRKIKSVLVTSPGEQEGKSTVAVRLALAAARAGLDVVLVDADLRRAGATAKLGLKPTVGLGLVLAEQRPAESAMIDWPLSQDDAGRLRVLAAGDAPPNPAALISSDAMRELISDLSSRFDLVVIDTPAALAVSDAVPLMQSVSGVVLIARMNRSSRDTIRRLHKIITSAHGLLLGTVATGVTSGPGYEKYSNQYYGTVDRGSKRRRKSKRGEQSGDGEQRGKSDITLTHPRDSDNQPV